MNLLQELLSVIQRFTTRAIKDASEWDGSATNYPDTDSYCRACLIDVNDAAGRATKVQSHCMLPVRGPNDNANVFVRQAVFAAVGGRGIGQVRKPDDVPIAAWDSAVANAAQKLVSAYEQMDSDPPESVVALAGVTTMRATSIMQVLDSVMTQLNPGMPESEEGEDEAEGQEESMPDVPYTQLLDVYTENGLLFAVVNQDGKLYRIPVIVDATTDLVTLGTWVPVVATFAPAQRLSVTRAANGDYRWVSVSCTAILNRDGEIDSTALFDDFVNRLANGAPYPKLDFYHINSIELGQADYVARDGVTLITSGVFNHDPASQAAARSLSQDTAGYWGTSIQYQPHTAPQLWNVAGVNLPVYTTGTLSRVTIVPEHKAAALFTTINTQVRNTMEKNIQDELLKLLGDSALVGQVAAQVDGVNTRTVTDNLISREAQAAPAPVPAPATAQPAPDVLPAPEDVMGRFMQTFTALAHTLDVLRSELQTTVTAQEQLTARLATLEGVEQARQRMWRADLPEVAPTGVIIRNRAAAPSAPAVIDSAAQAADVLAKFKVQY